MSQIELAHLAAGILLNVGPEWSENLVLAAGASLPPGAHLWRRTANDGVLAAIVYGGGPSAPWVVQLLHLARELPEGQYIHTCGAELEYSMPCNDRMCRLEPGQAMRLPTIEEAYEALSRFTQPGVPFVAMVVTGPAGRPMEYSPMMSVLFQQAAVAPGDPHRGALRGPNAKRH